MTTTLALLVLAYIFLAALLVLCVTYGRIHWILKSTLVLTTAAFYLFSYQGWKQSRGWPTPTEVPDNFIFHASVIDEPDEETGFKGQIYIWGTELIHGEPVSQPRAYVVPYDKEIHSSLQDALRNQRNGMVQLGAHKHNVDPGNMTRDGSLLGDENNTLEFKTLPDPALPEK